MRQPARARDRTWNGLVDRILLLYLAVLGAALLMPQPEIQPIPTPPGTRFLPPGWLADALRNVALFVPLGLWLTRRGHPTRSAVLIGVLVSIAAEAAQLVIPGRFPSPTDVVSNALGAALGAFAARHGQILLRPPPDRARQLSLAGSCLAALGLLATASLLDRDTPSSRLYGARTPELGNLAVYRGTVVHARVGGATIGEGGPLADQDGARRALAEGDLVELQAVAGPSPERLAPLLTVHDEHQREILLLGLDGEDIVFRRRTRAAAIGLEGPTHRLLGGGRSLVPGRLFSLRVRADRPGPSIEVGNRPAASVALSPGGLRRLWIAGLARDRWPDRWLDAAWLGGLFVPAAYWARRRFAPWTGLTGLGVAVALLPAFAPLQPAPWLEWAGVVAGVGSGWGLALLVTRASDPET